VFSLLSFPSEDGVRSNLKKTAAFLVGCDGRLLSKRSVRISIAFPLPLPYL